MSLKNSICKKIVSACFGKASLALVLGFLIFNPVSAHAACTVGNEIEINDWDGWAGEGFNPNAAEGGPCIVSQYRAPINRFGGGNWEACSDSGANPSSAKNPGPHAGTTQAGKCISRVWRNGSSNSNATQCKVFGYECSGGGSAAAQCSTAEPEKCLSGTYQDETDTATEYKWSCTSSSGGATASVSCGFSKGVTAVNGLCSATANQCTYGTFAEETDTATEFLWRCNGLNGGTNSGICRANKVIPAECGYASGGTYTSSPLAADSLCATGSPSGVSGDGTPTAPWSWSCTGINGGANANCSANLCLPPEDGVCNNTTRNSCASGDLSNAGENATHYTWQCNGRYGGGNATNCSRVKNTTTGVCNRSVENGCTSGTLNNTVDSGTHFLWQCLGSEGGASDSCDMLKPAAVNGACSSSVNGCSAGDFVDAADDTVNYRWQCNGRNGGTNQPCSAAIPPSAESGVCNTTTVNGCSKGSAFDISSDTSNDYWKCSGTNGGATSPQCTKAKTVGKPRFVKGIMRFPELGNDTQNVTGILNARWWQPPVEVGTQYAGFYSSTGAFYACIDTNIISFPSANLTYYDAYAAWGGTPEPTGPGTMNVLSTGTTYGGALYGFNVGNANALSSGFVDMGNCIVPSQTVNDPTNPWASYIENQGGGIWFEKSSDGAQMSSIVPVHYLHETTSWVAGDHTPRIHTNFPFRPWNGIGVQGPTTYNTNALPRNLYYSGTTGP